MKRKVLITINSILASIISLIGFVSCSKIGIGRIECMYGGPDMMNRGSLNPTNTNQDNDTLKIGTEQVKPDTQKIEKDREMRVMYGTPYQRFSEEKKEILPEEEK